MAAERFSYVEMDPSLGSVSALPYVPLELEMAGKVVIANGLVDSGATLNVLPYDIGVQLGAVWDQLKVPVKLTGNLAQSEVRAILVNCAVGQFPPVRLAFAWTQKTQVPIILGQVNFFMEFDICFFRSQAAFEIQPKS